MLKIRVTITRCDGCGKELEKPSKIYKLNLKTERFWDGTETSYLEQDLDFCRECATDIKNTLARILERLEEIGK